MPSSILAAGAGGHAVLLRLAYEGSSFHGWARQAEERTVAGEVLGAIREVDARVGDVRGASRTDAGVHARCQLALFRSERAIPAKAWALLLSRHLPDSIAVRSASLVPETTDLHRSIVRKYYRYTILCDAVRDPFWERRAWRLGGTLDIGRMRTELQTVVGTHDFSAYRSSADRRISTTRTIEEVAVQFDGVRLLRIDVVGPAFMHNMVRILVGSLVEVGLGRLPPGCLARALCSGSRRDLGLTAPPDGLCLEHIEHTVELLETWPLLDPDRPGAPLEHPFLPLV